MYEWMLQITYSYNGKRFTRTIASPERPLRSTGPQPGVPIYAASPGENNTAIRVRKTARLTSTNCDRVAGKT